MKLTLVRKRVVVLLLGNCRERHTPVAGPTFLVLLTRPSFGLSEKRDEAGCFKGGSYHSKSAVGRSLCAVDSSEPSYP